LLTLASASPQRRAILEQLGVEFQVLVPDVEELTEGDPATLVVENALRKARAVEADPVLAADTEVVLDGRIFGKATSEAEAEEFLTSLRGRTHEVWGGLAVLDGGSELTAHAVTRVTFRDFDVRWYIATGEWQGRAGAYAIQGKGTLLVERIEGDYWNVVGLPLAELVRIAPQLVVSRQSTDDSRQRP